MTIDECCRERTRDGGGLSLHAQLIEDAADKPGGYALPPELREHRCRHQYDAAPGLAVDEPSGCPAPYRGLVDAELAVVGDDEVFRVGRGRSRQVRAAQILLGTGQRDHVLSIACHVVS